MIHKFETLQRSNRVWDGRNFKQLPYYPQHVTYLFKALEAHINSIRQTLDFFVEVNLTKDLILRYEENDPYPVSDNARLIAIDIRDLEQERRKEEAQAKVAWLKATFEERLSCAPEAFLSKYRELETYAALAREFTRTDNKLSPSDAKAIVQRLTLDYPEIVNRVPDPKKILRIRN
jgi:predicted transcriptional regulator